MKPAMNPMMNPAILPLPFNAARLRGLSERLMQSHYQNNYGGAVKRLHAIRGQLGTLDWAAAPVFAINGLKREELVAANSMFLHKLYFASLGGDGALKLAGKPAGFTVGVNRDFGSVDRWRAEFTALAGALGGGSGWALPSWSDREHRLINHWAADHTHLLAGANAKAYVAAFMDNIDWSAVALRYATAVEASTASLAIGPEELLQSVTVTRIDVRRKGAFEAGKEVVVYCVYGHEMGQSTAARLHDAGIAARYLTGGI